MQLVLEICEGGGLADKVWREVRSLCSKFLSIGTSETQRACNARRKALLAKWQEAKPGSHMSEYGLPDVPYAKGISEAEPPFELREPEYLGVRIWASKVCPVNAEAAAMVQWLDEQGSKIRLHIFLAQLEDLAGHLHWKGFCMSLEDLLIHEFLHICGDTQHDGIVRHNIIGIEAVKPLLRQG